MMDKVGGCEVHKINNLQCPFFPLLWSEPEIAQHSRRIVRLKDGEVISDIPITPVVAW
jgi:hypothetical protein